MTVVFLIILGLYLFLVTFSAVLGSLGAKIITPRNMLLTLFLVLVVIAFTYIYLYQRTSGAIYGVAGGLFALSGVALSNALNMRQRPRLIHHVIRLVFNVVVLILMYWCYIRG